MLSGPALFSRLTYDGTKIKDTVHHTELFTNKNNTDDKIIMTMIIIDVESGDDEKRIVLTKQFNRKCMLYFEL